MDLLIQTDFPSNNQNFGSYYASPIKYLQSTYYMPGTYQALAILETAHIELTF